LIWSNIRRKRTIIIYSKNKKNTHFCYRLLKKPMKHSRCLFISLSLSLAWKILTDFIYSTLAELRALLFSSYFNLQRNHNLYVFTFLSFTFLLFIYFYLIHLCHAMCHFIVMHFLSMLLICNSGFCLRLVCWCYRSEKLRYESTVKCVCVCVYYVARERVRLFVLAYLVLGFVMCVFFEKLSRKVREAKNKKRRAWIWWRNSCFKNWNESTFWPKPITQSLQKFRSLMCKTTQSSSLLF